MDKNKIKNVIIVLFIIFILLIVFITILLIKKNTSENLNDFSENNIQNNEYIPDDIFERDQLYLDEEETKTSNFKNKSDKYTYFFVKQCMEAVYSSIENAYNLLDEEAINQLDINQSNFNSIYGLVSKPSFCIDEIMEEDLNFNRKLYYIQYRLETNENSNIKKKVLIKFDEEYLTFSIYPNEFLNKNQINNIKEGDFLKVNGSKNIEETEINRYNVDLVSTDPPAVMSELLRRLQFDINFDLNHLYNALDENYKKTRFENNTEKFLQYINEYKDIILNDKITSYQLYNTEEYTQYYGLASSQNHYIFNTYNIMDYSILLDNYTVDLPQTKEVYEKGSAKGKSEYCLKKVINAINNKNYNLIYDKLSLTQKSQYSSSEEFANYLRRAFYDKNDYEIEDYMILNKENAYQFLIKITDSTKKEASFRRYNIRIVLKENMDYIVNITQYKMK